MCKFHTISIRLMIQLSNIAGQLWLMLTSTGNQVRHRAHDDLKYPYRNVLPILSGKVSKQPSYPVYHQPWASFPKPLLLHFVPGTLGKQGKLSTHFFFVNPCRFNTSQDLNALPGQALPKQGRVQGSPI